LYNVPAFINKTTKIHKKVFRLSVIVVAQKMSPKGDANDDIDLNADLIVPHAPSALEITEYDATSANLKWKESENAQEANVTGYVIEYRNEIHQLLGIILKLRILVLLPVSTLPYVVKVKNHS
jgi:hypothetical protein